MGCIVDRHVESAELDRWRWAVSRSYTGGSWTATAGDPTRRAACVACRDVAHMRFVARPASAAGVLWWYSYDLVDKTFHVPTSHAHTRGPVRAEIHSPAISGSRRSPPHKSDTHAVLHTEPSLDLHILSPHIPKHTHRTHHHSSVLTPTRSSFPSLLSSPRTRQPTHAALMSRRGCQRRAGAVSVPVPVPVPVEASSW